MNKQVFYDPNLTRWKRLRGLLNVVGVLALIVGVIFIFGLLRVKPMQELLLPSTPHNYRALIQPPAPVLKSSLKLRRSAHRKTDVRPSDVTLNSGEGLRAAYYVDWDPASYSSLKQHIKQIDLLFPEWLHMITTDGTLTGYTVDNHPFDVVDEQDSRVRNVDHENKVARVIADAHVDTEVFPLVNNYDPTSGTFVPAVGSFLASATARDRFVHQVHFFLEKSPNYRGISLDFEQIPTDAQPGYMALIASLYTDFQAHQWKLYLNTPVGDDDYNLAYMASHSDGLVIMNYDQHQTDSEPGPIAAQDWFIDNLKTVLKTVPKDKILCGVGSYGYDWTMPLPPAIRV